LHSPIDQSSPEQAAQLHRVQCARACGNGRGAWGRPLRKGQAFTSSSACAIAGEAPAASSTLAMMSMDTKFVMHWGGARDRVGGAEHYWWPMRCRGRACPGMHIPQQGQSPCCARACGGGVRRPRCCSCTAAAHTGGPQGCWAAASHARACRRVRAVRRRLPWGGTLHAALRPHLAQRALLPYRRPKLPHIRRFHRAGALEGRLAAGSGVTWSEADDLWQAGRYNAVSFN
jgi:hypothetical protein